MTICGGLVPCSVASAVMATLLLITPVAASPSCKTYKEARAAYGGTWLYWHTGRHCWNDTPSHKGTVRGVKPSLLREPTHKSEPYIERAPNLASEPSTVSEPNPVSEPKFVRGPLVLSEPSVVREPNTPSEPMSLSAPRWPAPPFDFGWMDRWPSQGTSSPLMWLRDLYWKDKPMTSMPDPSDRSLRQIVAMNLPARPHLRYRADNSVAIEVPPWSEVLADADAMIEGLVSAGYQITKAEP